MAIHDDNYKRFYSIRKGIENDGICCKFRRELLADPCAGKILDQIYPAMLIRHPGITLAKLNENGCLIIDT
jgi:hypothetical protein